MSEILSFAKENGLVQVTLNRPEKCNALNLALFDALIEAGERIKRDKQVRAVVLNGAGGNFSAGLDLSNFESNTIAENLKDRSHGVCNRYQYAAWLWREVEVPVIAAVEGACLGGGLQIISGADMRYIHPNAKLSIREIEWGLVPDMAGTQLWPHYVRDDVLRELTYTGRIFSGEEAVHLGFATQLCEAPLEHAIQIAESICAKSPDAIRASKRLFNTECSQAIAQGLLAESVEQSVLFSGANQREAVRASFEKRSPKFIDPE